MTSELSIFCLTPNLFKNFQDYQNYEDANFSLNDI